MYDLIKLHSSIEFFKFKSIKFENDLRFIYLFNGKQVLIYEIDEMIEKAYDKTKKHPDEVLDFDDEEDALIPITIDTDGMQPFEFDAMLDNKSLDLIGLETLAIDKQTAGGLIIRNRISHKLILNNFIEFDLLHKGDLESSFKKYKHFRSFHYCLELLLFKHLTDEKCLPLKRLFQLIEFTDNSEFIYINCLRKIEIGYWNTFFNVLETTPEDFMNRLIEIENVELCYNYLIIYLNYKHEDEKSSKDQLSEVDKEIILKIITMLTRAGKWDWCFELCRFVKILEHSDEFLKQIKQELE
ncbi:Guanine nucleotide exchange factor subunit RIC1 [Candida tropicalis]